jgi:DNA-binding response OmpR family regulator
MEAGLISDRKSVLLVEDEGAVVDTIRDGLPTERIKLDVAGNLAEAETRLAGRSYDALILDLGLPDGSGLDLAQKLRGQGNDIPILMLTAQAEVRQRLEGFARGADDYICKPFVAAELFARLSAVLRRGSGSQTARLRYAHVELDLLKRTLKTADFETSLSDREAALLAYLMRRPEEPVNRREIAQEIFGLDPETDHGVVNVYVNYLRNKLERGNQKRRLIHTLRGVGYVLSDKPPG